MNNLLRKIFSSLLTLELILGNLLLPVSTTSAESLSSTDINNQYQQVWNFWVKKDWEIINNPTFEHLTNRTLTANGFNYDQNNKGLRNSGYKENAKLTQELTLTDFNPSDKYYLFYSIKWVQGWENQNRFRITLWNKALMNLNKNPDPEDWWVFRFDKNHIGKEKTKTFEIIGQDIKNYINNKHLIIALESIHNNNNRRPRSSVTQFLVKTISLKKVYQKITFEKQTDETFPTPLQDQIVAYGSTADRPTLQPTKDLHRFECWTKDNNTCFDFSTPITEDTTLHAKRIKQHTVTFQKEIQGTRTQIAQKIVDKGSRLSFDNISTPSESNYTFLGWFLDDQKLDPTNLPVVSSDITITAKFQPQDTTAPQVDNQDLYLFESRPISNIKLQASDQDNIWTPWTYTFVPANFWWITLDENGNIWGTSPKNNQLNKIITVRDNQWNETSAKLNIYIVKPISKPVVNYFWDNITEQQIKDSISPKVNGLVGNQIPANYITNMSILDPIPTGWDQQQDVQVELTNIYGQKTTITTSVSYIYKKVKTLKQTIYSGDSVEIANSSDQTKFEDDSSAENKITNVAWKKTPSPTNIANTLSNNLSGETNGTLLVTYADNTQKKQSVKIIWNPQSWRNYPQAKQNITKEINADISNLSQFIEWINNSKDTPTYSRVGDIPDTATYGTKTGTIKITYSDGSRDEVQINFEVLTDVIENPTQVPSPKYYAKVEFLPGTNGKLNRTTVFYVLKNKEINLTAPIVTPNFGYTFNGRNTQVATNFTTDVTYTAQYTSSKVTLTHSHASLTAGKNLPTSMPTISDIETTYFTQTSPVNATLADVSDTDLDGVWKFQSWSPTTITVNTSSDPTNFTGQWAFTPNQHSITYIFKAEDQNLTLPNAVTDLKPQNTTAIMGDVINPFTTFNPIEITDTTNPLKTGTWTFVARNQASKTVEKSDVEFIGTWKFTPKPATVRYEFQSDDTTALLESLNAYKPADENTTYGQTITPTSPKKTSEKTSEGTWKWKGWTETSKQVTEDVITFVGKWLFDPKPTGSITGQPTQWTKNTVTLTLTTNEDVSTPNWWTPVNNSKREFTKDIEGNSTISVVVTDLGGNDSVQITATVDKIDKVNPTLVTLATKGKVSLIKEAQVEIHFAGEDKLGTNPINNNSGIKKYQCKLNNENWTTCNSPFTVKNLTEWTNTIKVKAIDNAGNQSDEKKVSIVSDRTAPVITLENWDLTLIHNVDTYKPANASCKDKIDDSCTVTKSWPDVPAEIEKLKGSAIKDPVKFTEVFTATDKAGNKKQITRTITLIPADFPKITLIGLPTVTQELGTPYTDAGATAQDKQDGDITTNIVINNPVQDKLWTYTITYNVSDKSHNKAPEVTRTVTVVDTTKPTITPVSNQGFDEGKTITPIQITVTDHNPVVNIKVDGLPSGLSFDPTTKQITGKSSVIWIHTITITATDGSNNSQTSKFTLEIRDITPPVLESLKEKNIRLRKRNPAEIVLTGTDNYMLGKIEIIGTLPAGMSISKTDFDGQKLAYLKITGTPTNIGKYQLTWTIVDKAGNKWNQIPFTIRVRATDPWSLNGGGGSSSSTDYCPNGDHSGNLYDGKCDKTIITITTGDNNPVEKKPVLTGDLEKKPEPEKDSKPELIDGKTLYPDTVLFNPTIINGKCYTRRPYVGIKDSTTIITDEEFKKAMSFLRSYEMTMFDSVDDYDPYRNLSREEAAKIFSNFAINVLCRKPDLNLKVNYSDVEDANPTLKPYITLAYQLGVMKGSGMGDGLFRPFDKITKAEVNAVLIRMILKSYLDESQSESKTWYDEYNKVATNLGIINQGAGAQPVSRNNVALMLFRAYKNQAFDWRNVDYFSYVLNSRDLFVKKN